jgi:hypothetical protein
MPNKRVADLLIRFPEDFSGKKIVKKSELKEYAAKQIPDMTEQEFRSVLYQLTNHSNLISSGSGIFLIRDTKTENTSNLNPLKKKYKPTPSDFLLKIVSEIKTEFTDVALTIWETRELNQFMVHQPFVNFVILEVEKDSVESLFNTFSEIYPGKTFLSPDQLVIERYVMQQKEVLIISKSITQTPRGRKRSGWPYAKLEKMLVDIFVNKDIFIFYQGSEMIAIFEEAFKKFLIDEPSLFRYAGRRNAEKKLKEFIQTKTNIELLTIS